MGKVHVLVAAPLAKVHLEMISSVDPGVTVDYALEEIRVERGMAVSSMMPPYVQPKVSPTPEQATRALDRMLADTDAILGWRLPLNVRHRAPQLRWLQGVGAGIDMVVAGSDIMQSDVIVTVSRGVRSTYMAEYVLCLMLTMARQIPRLVANKSARRWDFLVGMQLSGATLGIVGLGSVGTEVARLGKAFGMRVIASKRSATSRQQNTAGVDEVFPANQLLQMLPECDFVVLTPPLTAETTGLIGEAELRALKRTAFLVNVSRGPVIKEQLLVRALTEGWLAGTALDVYEKEPLPSDSALWDLPNAFISPHIAGAYGGVEHTTKVVELFCENLRRFMTGRSLLNVVDRKRGY
ncbi:MAG: D-2-hydroxyacid dehydrogenase [Chloroflexi bacterium]|nr:D-2-hydroxyacid dehydrogenase [Chloroflexota bacterium]